MNITFKKELFIDLMAELPELFYEHWREAYTDADRSPLDVDWQRYILLELQGMVHVMAARADGKLIGYYIAMVMPHIHSKSTLTAFSDMFFIRKAFRRKGTGLLGAGYKLIFEADKMLKALGVHKSYLVTKVHLPITIILKRLKYFFVEQVHVKIF